MFDPVAAKKRKLDAGAMRKATEIVRKWVIDLCPEQHKADIDTVTVSEEQCGDPGCSPLDTIIMIYWTSSSPTYRGIPMPIVNVKQEDIEAVMPFLMPGVAQPANEIMLSPDGQYTFINILNYVLPSLDQLDCQDALGVCQRFLRVFQEEHDRFQAQMDEEEAAAADEVAQRIARESSQTSESATAPNDAITAELLATAFPDALSAVNSLRVLPTGPTAASAAAAAAAAAAVAAPAPRSSTPPLVISSHTKDPRTDALTLAVSSRPEDPKGDVPTLMASSTAPQASHPIPGPANRGGTNATGQSMQLLSLLQDPGFQAAVMAAQASHAQSMLLTTHTGPPSSSAASRGIGGGAATSPRVVDISASSSASMQTAETAAGKEKRKRG